jgi:hypothetical protein
MVCSRPERRSHKADLISGHPSFRDAALEDVKTWKFATESTKPNIRYQTESIYKLDVQHKKGAPKLTVMLTDFRRVEVSSELYMEPIEQVSINSIIANKRLRSDNVCYRQQSSTPD